MSMSLKKFDDYLIGKSTDPSVFERKVVFATRGAQCDLFKTISEESEIFSESMDTPVVIWGDFKFTPKIINENRFSLYNINEVPRLTKIYENFQEESFVPKLTRERLKVGSLKFPIIASTDTEEKRFKSYGAFKKSEEGFNLFTESPKVETSLDVIIFKKEPIHIQENIRGIGFDISLPGFKHLGRIKEVAEKIAESQVLDLYQLNFGESGEKL